MRKFIFLFFSLIFINQANAQLENIIVELYYVSDANDETDTLGGSLPVGSKTYRVYADLTPNAKIKRLYGDANHPIIIRSTENFFNNKADGKSFGFEFPRTRLDENTVALDTWLTLGQVTTNSTKQAGLLKANDTNGSFVAGIGVNDGGSAEIADGLLNNNDPLAGIPLSEADGNDTMDVLPTAAGSIGIVNIIDQSDSTIFGSIIPGNNFESRNASVFNSGTKGIDTTINHVLLAQLTTLGEIYFELNLEIEVETPNGNQIIKYVARDSVLAEDELLSSALVYPPQCGCQDPNYLEFSPSYACGSPDSCQTLIVFGCLDPLACNYDPSANFNIIDLCCYIGDCNDLDISVVCPELSTGDLIQEQNYLNTFPNPGKNNLSISGNFTPSENYSVVIRNTLGAIVFSQVNATATVGSTLVLNQLNLIPGVYFISVENKNARMFGKWINQ
jgi:hypothetical protein